MKREFWAGRRVLLTGHTGFKGAWTAALLTRLGAKVFGIALEPDGEPNLWRLFAGRVRVAETICDLRDAARLGEACRTAQPQIVVHMAAQAQVRRGYREPAETHATNVMGTVNLLEALRVIAGLEAILVVTSDKVYANPSDGMPLGESARLGGSDPYSASKAAAELIVRSYADSYFSPGGIPLATARAGNVLGGGDFASDRLVPDVVRAARASQPVVLRFPQAQRPWQHVLDCISGYLRYVEFIHGQQVANPPALNFGSGESVALSVAQVADLVGLRLGNPMPWRQGPVDNPPERMSLILDCSLAPHVLGWSPRLGISDTVNWTADWYAAYAEGADPFDLVSSQIKQYAPEAF